MNRREEQEAEAFNAGCADAECAKDELTSLSPLERRIQHIRKAYLEGYRETVARLRKDRPEKVEGGGCRKEP